MKPPTRAVRPDAEALARNLAHELVDKLEAISTAAPSALQSKAHATNLEPLSGNVKFELGNPRVMLENAGRFIAPRLPAEASIRSVKALLLRVLRIVTRDQTAFNSVMVEAFRSALDEIENGSVRIDRALREESGTRASASRPVVRSSSRASTRCARRTATRG